jgi:hypothetical protein
LIGKEKEIFLNVVAEDKTAQITIAINDVNDIAPTNIALSNNNITVNASTKPTFATWICPVLLILKKPSSLPLIIAKVVASVASRIE